MCALANSASGLRLVETHVLCVEDKAWTKRLDEDDMHTDAMQRISIITLTHLDAPLFSILDSLLVFFLDHDCFSEGVYGSALRRGWIFHGFQVCTASGSGPQW